MQSEKRNEDYEGGERKLLSKRPKVEGRLKRHRVIIRYTGCEGRHSEITFGYTGKCILVADSAKREIMKRGGG